MGLFGMCFTRGHQGAESQTIGDKRDLQKWCQKTGLSTFSSTPCPRYTKVLYKRERRKTCSAVTSSLCPSLGGKGRFPLHLELGGRGFGGTLCVFWNVEDRADWRLVHPEASITCGRKAQAAGGSSSSSPTAWARTTRPVRCFLSLTSLFPQSVGSGTTESWG